MSNFIFLKRYGFSKTVSNLLCFVLVFFMYLQTSTALYAQDTEIPVITTNGQSADLGCNPEIIPPEFKVTDNCSEIEIPLDPETEGPTNDGCYYSQTWTANYTDACLNDAVEVSVTYTWIQDTEVPVITTNGQDEDLGCNPEIIPPEFKVTDNCSDEDMALEPETEGPMSENGCEFTQTWTANYIDGCLNEAVEVSVSYKWSIDLIENCETAFARDPDNNICFIPDFSRWGWTNHYQNENAKGVPYNLDLYAGAAHCNIDNRTPVGDVNVNYFGGFVTVTFNIDEGFVMSEAHVYIGCEMYPSHRRRGYTVAPGQYNFNPTDDLDYVNTYTVGPIEATGSIYVIAHAVVCEEICSCSESENDNGVFTPDEGDSVNCEIEEPTTTFSFSSMFTISQLRNSDLLSVNLEFDYDTNVKIEILNANGLTIRSKTINSYKKGDLGQLKFNLSNVDKGILFVRLISDKGVEIKKIMMTNY